jgi:SNF family Na+-dependent transporter
MGWLSKQTTQSPRRNRTAAERFVPAICTILLRSRHFGKCSTYLGVCLRSSEVLEHQDLGPVAKVLNRCGGVYVALFNRCGSVYVALFRASVLPVSRLREALNRTSRLRIPRLFDWLIKLVIPAGLLTILVSSAWQETRAFYGTTNTYDWGRRCPTSPWSAGW